MKKYIFIIVLLVMGINKCLAGVEPELKSYLTGSPLTSVTPLPSLETYDAVFYSSGGTRNGTSTSIYSGLVGVRNLVWLEINQAELNDCETDTFSFTARVMIEMKDEDDNPLTTQYDTLRVFYDKANGKSYVDKHTVAYFGAYYCKVTVLWISNSSVVEFVQINNSMLIERYKALNTSTQPVFSSGSIDETNGVIEVEWNSITGAEEYDLEWTLIDDYGNPDLAFGSGATLDADDIDWNFKNNATRVTLKDNLYKIPYLNEHGYLIVRVRAVGRNGNLFSKRIEGAWSSDSYGPKIDNSSGTSFTLGEDVFRFVYETIESGLLGGTGIVKAHESTLNWQYTSTFAEEGKRKEVVGYSDGSMRNRQLVTLINSDNTAVAGETVYDYQGRQAGSFMPVPTFENRLKFYPNFNLSDWSGKNYGPGDFDSTINYCGTRFIAPLDESSGAGLYYSANNPNSGQMHYEYIPDAQGYAFSVTEYMPDGTGRIRKQSGVGIDHTIGSGHETKYFYGTPDQIELDRLFGTAVGYSQHYQKHMIIDPNGQVSVSYLDLQGRVIATALSGESPENVHTLPAIGNDTLLSISIPVDFKSDISVNSIQTSKQIIVTVEDNHVFDYSIEVPRHSEVSQPLMCFDCIYDLEIKLIDECGDNVLDGDPNTGGIQLFTRTVGKPQASLEWDVSCSTILYSFTLDDELNNEPITKNLTVGSYTLIKTLKINELAYAYYEQEFLSDNDSIRTLEDFKEEFVSMADFGQCEINCDSCYIKLGGWSDFLNTELNRLVTEGITPNADDSAAILGTYQSLSSFCAGLCVPIDKSCEQMLDVILADVSPGGQYAPLSIVDNETVYGGILSPYFVNIYELGFNYSWFWNGTGDTGNLIAMHYLDEDGRVIKVSKNGLTPDQLSPSEFVEYFEPEWANSLAKYHPEYCKYEMCKENEAAEIYERNMLNVFSYQEAIDSGFLNPLDTLSPFVSGRNDPYFQVGGNGISNKLAFSNLLANYKDLDETDPYCNILSVWEIAKVTYLCNYSECVQISDCLTENDWEEITCQPILDNIWIMFRSIYLAERRKIIEENFPPNCPRETALSNYIERFPSINTVDDLVISSETNKNTEISNVTEVFLLECDTVCMSNADIWIEKLRDCGWNATDSANFRAQLIAVCRNSCDAEHPYGASSHPNGLTKRITVEKPSYTSFRSVFEDYVNDGKMIFSPGSCDINSIGFPLDYDHSYSKFIDNDGEPCTKEGYEPLPCTQSVPDAGLADMYKRKHRFEIPDSAKCEKCITCRELHTVLSLVQTEYGGSIDVDNFEIKQAVTNSLNRQLNFNLGWLDYYDFMMECGEYTASDSNVLELFIDLWAIEGNMEVSPSNRLFLKPNYRFDYNKRPELLIASVDDVFALTVSDTVPLNSCMCNALMNPSIESVLTACLTSYGADYNYLKSFCQTFYQINAKSSLTYTSIWPDNVKNKLKTQSLVKRIYVPSVCFLDYSCGSDRPVNETNPFYSRVNPNPPTPGGGGGGGGGGSPDSARTTTCDSIKMFLRMMDSICLANLTCSPSFKEMIRAYLFNKNPYYLSTAGSLLTFVNMQYEAMFPHLKKETRFTGDPFKKFLAMLHLYNGCVRESYYVYDPDCCKQPNKYALALMATLNKLTSDYDPMFGNLLTIDDQKLHPSVPQYYNSKLYNGLYKSTVEFTNDPYGMPDITLKFTDSLSHLRKVILSYTDNLYNEAEWSYIVKVKDFKLVTLDYLCDSTNRFEFTAIQMTSWGEEEVKISGYFPGLNLGDTCDSNPSLKLCDRNYWESHIQPDTNDCRKRIENWANYMAERAYDKYIALQKIGFRERYLAKCLNGFSGENLTVQKPDHEYHYTLYYYDQAGNLIQTVPPSGVVRLTNSTTLGNVLSNRISDGSAVIPSHNLETVYEFNSLNQLIVQNTPDGGESKFWYDNLGRLVISQNSKQYSMSPKGYSYTVFDALGRITEVGQLQNSTTMTVAIAFDKEDLASFVNLVSKTEVTRSIYDESSGSFPAETYFIQKNLRSRVSSIQYFPTLSSGAGVSGTYSQAVHYTYDIHGNVDVLLREMPSLSDIDQDFKSVIYKYDLVSGNVNQVVYQFRQQDMFAHKYIYDADNRVIETYSSHDLWHWDNDATYSYHTHGPLARTELGGLKVQGLDYAYTLHGWIKGVNSTTLRTSRDIGRDGEVSSDNQLVAKDVYGYSLGFFEGDYTPIGLSRTSTPIVIEDLFTPLTTTSALGSASNNLWNGNIRHMVTAIKPFMALNSMPQARAYKYDQLNRIKDAYTYNEVELDSNLWKYTGSANLDYEEHFSYDANGNILTLSRNGTNSGGNVHDMDDFIYHYNANTNQLDYVDDSKASGNYSDDIDDQSSGNYTYDALGNLISDDAEEIASIEWTVYGKIKSITRTGGSSKPDLEFEYSPDGHRVSKKVLHSNGNITFSYYIRDAHGNTMSIYNRNIDISENDTLVWSEAHIYGSSRLGIYKPQKKLYGNGNPVLNYVSGNGTLNTRGDKYYELSNHLGNVLVVITDKRTGICDEEDEIIAFDADIIDATDYYSFGSPMPGRRGLQSCTTVAVADTAIIEIVNEDFQTTVGGFSVTGARTLSRPTGQYLRISSSWTTKPLSTRSVNLINGRTYTLKIDIVGFSTVSGFTHNTRVRVLLPGSTQTFDFSTATGTQTISFTSNTTGAVNIEVSSVITPGTGTYGTIPYLDIDNFIVSWDSIFTTNVTTCAIDSSKYRYGFNGMEKVNEIAGEGNDYDFGARIYDGRLGRFFSIDPSDDLFPFVNPYNFAQNCPIYAIDFEGHAAAKSKPPKWLVTTVRMVSSTIVSFFTSIIMVAANHPKLGKVGGIIGGIFIGATVAYFSFPLFMVPAGYTLSSVVGSGIFFILGTFSGARLGGIIEHLYNGDWQIAFPSRYNRLLQKLKDSEGYKAEQKKLEELQKQSNDLNSQINDIDVELKELYEVNSNDLKELMARQRIKELKKEKSKLENDKKDIDKQKDEQENKIKNLEKTPRKSRKKLKND